MFPHCEGGESRGGEVSSEELAVTLDLKGLGEGWVYPRLPYELREGRYQPKVTHTERQPKS